MSIRYTLAVTLDVELEKKYIQKFLEEGVLFGFIYFDIEGNKLTPSESAEYIIKNIETEINTPHIYVSSSKIGSFMIGFYVSDLEQLKVSLGGFGIPIRRDFLFSPRAIDWAYYINFFLPIFKNFAIVKLETI